MNMKLDSKRLKNTRQMFGQKWHFNNFFEILAQDWIILICCLEK